MTEPTTFDSWRQTARRLLAAGLKADGVPWGEETAAAAATAATLSAASARMPAGDVRLPRRLMHVLETIACYRHAGRWELMYRLAWRTLFENRRLLEDAADPDVAKSMSMQRAVRRDIHKMHAFVRFREIVEDGAEPAYFAWFEPQHEILRAGVTFFVKRFPNMRWTIATPDGAAAWDLDQLRFVESPDAASRPRADAHEDLWRTYYRSICNVARINRSAMQREMPQHYWRNLPEAAEIGPLLRDGHSRFAAAHRQTDQEQFTAAKSVQRALSRLPAAGDGPQECRRCDLWKHATQAVAGQGPAAARIMLVGEQPGDEEDLRGRPFVGPAGKVLDESLETAGLDRGAVFITNAVKHFKWEPRGKRRLHKRPHTGEIEACQVWLEREISAGKPRIIVALGATALRALTGSSLSVDAARHTALAHASGARVIATYHPSAILRAQGERADVLRAALIEDLRRARDMLARETPGNSAT